MRARLDEKYRPKRIGDLVGLDGVKRAVEGLLRVDGIKERVFTLSGPTGTGKTTIARMLGAYLNCQNPTVDNGFIVDICGTCRMCLSALSMGKQFGGQVVIDHSCAAYRGIDEIHELKRGFKYMPPGNYRIYVLDEAHALTPQACDVLLKELEESLPPKVVICFCTDRRHELPHRLRSRGREWVFESPSEEEIKNYLKKISIAENYLDVASDDDLLGRISENCDGSVRDALKKLGGEFDLVDYRKAMGR